MATSSSRQGGKGWSDGLTQPQFDDYNLSIGDRFSANLLGFAATFTRWHDSPLTQFG